MFRPLAAPAALLALVVLLASSLRGDPPSATDYTDIDPQKLGIKPVTPKADAKTGFVVGGKNPTDRIVKLTEVAGRSIADLEEDMRPGGLSTAGFLGEKERLLDVLAMDNRHVVERLGLTHQELARHLEILGAIAVKEATQQPREIVYHGRRYRLRAVVFRNSVRSPFKDGTRTNTQATLENLGNGKKLTYSLLVPHMIERYGFYEGKGTRYRVEPRAILEVLDFVKPKDKR